MKLRVLAALATAALSATSFAYADDLQYAIKAGQHMPGGDYGKTHDKDFTFGFQVRSVGNNAYNYGGMSWGVHAAIANTEGENLTTLYFSNRTQSPGVSFNKTKLFETYIFGDRPLELSPTLNSFFRIGAGYAKVDSDAKLCDRVNRNICYNNTNPPEGGTGLMLVAGLGAHFMDNIEAVLLYNHVNSEGSFNYLTANLAFNF